MDCDICLEPFNDTDRRPKCLPCGHSFCLSCVTQQKDKKCPVDRKPYRSVPNNLPDNFKILELCRRPASVCGWCRSCDAEAADACLDEHPASMCSLKKARLEDVEPRLAALARGEEALAKLGDMMHAAAGDVQTQVQDCLDQVERERAELATVKGRQEAALGSDPATWVMSQGRTRRRLSSVPDKVGGVIIKEEPTEQVEKERPHPLQDHALTRGAVQLMADLADPTASCVVTVLRGGHQGGAPHSEVLWRGTVRPEEDAASRLLLSRMLCTETLRRELPLPLLQVKTEAVSTSEAMVPCSPVDNGASWVECSNETVLTSKQMQQLMKVGSRVARGEHWDQRWTDDGQPPGEGTIVAVDNALVYFFVAWDCLPSERRRYSMVPGYYRLRLLPHRPQAVLPQKKPDVLDLSMLTSVLSQKKPLPEKRVANKRVLVGLHCDVSPNWSKALLQRLSPQLEALAMVSAQQQHLRQAAAMAGLRALHLSGCAVSVDPVVDLTDDGAEGASVNSLEYAVEKAPLSVMLKELHIENATREELFQVPHLTSLRRLDLHCPFDSPLPVIRFFEPAAPTAGLLWLRLGIYPLRTALSLIKANCATLEELELVAATKDPYGCPDLPQQLQGCALSSLRRLVLWRGTVAGAFCSHSAVECLEQKMAMTRALPHAKTVCSECDHKPSSSAAALAALLAAVSPGATGGASEAEAELLLA